MRVKRTGQRPTVRNFQQRIAGGPLMDAQPPCPQLANARKLTVRLYQPIDSKEGN